MKTQYRFFLLLLMALVIASCNSSTENKTPAADTTVKKPPFEAKITASTDVETPLDQNPSLKAEMERLHEEWKNVPNPLIAKFENVELGDYFHLLFKDASGKSYDFGYGDNDLEGVDLYSDNGDFIVNSKMLGKQFSITWDWKFSSFYCCEGEMNDVKAKVPSIAKIVLTGK